MALVQDSEKANYFLTTSAQLLREPEDYDKGDLLLTREAVRDINKRMAETLLRFGAVRAQVAFYRCPWPCTKAIFEKTKAAAIKKWLRVMELNGWVLVSSVRLAQQHKWRTSSRLRGDWYSTPILDEVEIPIGAAFRKTDLRIVRTEVPVRDN